jgi:hypothetical protein
VEDLDATERLADLACLELEAHRTVDRLKRDPVFAQQAGVAG